jgi:MYXO-CTERM domain-containing protein
MKKTTSLLSLFALGALLATSTPALAQTGDNNNTETTTTRTDNDGDDHGKWGLAGLLGLLGLLGRRKNDTHVHTTNTCRIAALSSLGKAVPRQGFSLAMQLAAARGRICSSGWPWPPGWPARAGR